MPIYTKFGDKGKTALRSGEIVLKDDLHVEAYGSIDELNAMIGVILSSSGPGELDILSPIQRDLFTIGAELASKGPKTKAIAPEATGRLEAEIDHIESELPPLHHFVIPGGSKTASLLHLARTICRRAERRVVALSAKEKTNPETIMYLNRLGDLLFVMARRANYKKRVDEVIWKG